MPVIKQETPYRVRFVVEQAATYSLSCEIDSKMSFVASEGASVYVTATGSVVLSGGGGASIEATGSSVPEAGQVAIGGGALGQVLLTLVSGPAITLQPADLVLQVADSSIVMTPGSISFLVGDASYTILPGAIVEAVGDVVRTTSAEGHALTAGETVMNVGVAGFAVEAPAHEAECDARTLNAAIADVAIDGIKSEDAAIDSIE